MPAEAECGAVVFAASSSPSPVASPTEASARSNTTTLALPPWARTQSSSSSGRLTSRPRPYSRSLHSHSHPRLSLSSQAKSLLRTGRAICDKITRLYQGLPLWQRILVSLAVVFVCLLGILFLVFSHRIFGLLAPLAHAWRARPFGWLLVWFLTFVTAFPPLMGYGTCVTTTGFVYGFPLGWPIAATATVAGSLCAFLTSRGIFSGYVARLVGHDRKFVALSQVLRREGLMMLAAIRFCPLPYSLSNGFLATIPNVRAGAFAAATALASPKLLVHVFIGNQLARLAESGDKMSGQDRVVNYLSMLMGGLVGMGVSYLTYRRTMARAEEIALEEGDAAVTLSGQEEGYLDGSEGDVGDAEDVAALMDEDDISLWEACGDAEEGYRDSWEVASKDADMAKSLR